MTPKYPEITVTLSDQDGNAALIIARTSKAMRRGGISQDEIKRYREEATSGDYDHLLQTTMAWVNVE